MTDPPASSTNTEPIRAARGGAPLIAAAALYAVVVLAFIFPRWTVDDAYITFHYADNLARAGELTWNVGEDPIEGYTGVALPVILAGAIRAGIDPRTASALIGIAAFAAGGALLFVLMRGIGCAVAVRASALALYLTSPFMYTHATSGLETQLFSASILLSAFSLFRCLGEARSSFVREAGFSVALLFCALVRPEGAAAAAVFGSVFGVVRLGARDWAGLRRWTMLCALLCILPGLAYFVWRWQYYGQFLPNTFYAKTIYQGRAESEGHRDLAMFLWSLLALPGLAALAAGLGMRRDDPSARSAAARPVMLACGVFTALVLVQYWRSALVMNFSHRFFAPLYPMCLLGIAFAVRGFGPSGMDPRRAAAARWFAVALLVVQAGLHVRFLPGEMWYADWYRRLLNELHRPIAESILRDTPPDSWIICYKDAGIVPYLTRRKAIDFGRLNDERLARGNLTLAEKIDYFFGKNPSALLVTSFNFHRLDHDDTMRAIAADPRFGNYVLIDRRRLRDSTRSQPFFEFYYLRRDLAEARRPEGK